MALHPPGACPLGRRRPWDKYTQVAGGAAQGRTKGSGVGAEEVTEGAKMTSGRRGLWNKH